MNILQINVLSTSQLELGKLPLSLVRRMTFHKENGFPPWFTLIQVVKTWVIPPMP
jgi:hypothetical protein